MDQEPHSAPHTKSPSTRRWTAIVLSSVFLGACPLCYFANDSIVIANPHGLGNLHVANGIDAAVTGYRMEYDHMPPSPAAVIDTSTPEGIAFLTILLGQEKESGGSANPANIQFLTLKEGKRLKGGLNYNRSGKLVGLFDDWGHPYRIFLDTTGKGSITLPTGRVLTGRAAIAVSNGADGKPDTDDDIITGEPFPYPGLLNRLRRRWSR